MKAKHLVHSIVTALSALVVGASSSCAIAQGSDHKADAEFTIAGIYFFGTDLDNFSKVTTSLSVHIGDHFSQNELTKVQKSIRESVQKTIGQAPTDVAVINCGNQLWNIYTGLPGRSVFGINYNPSPTSEVKLPESAKAMSREESDLLLKVLKERGGCPEDDSKGYALSNDPDMRAVELRIHAWSEANDGIVHQVLATSADKEERATAAQFLGMQDPSPAQMHALVEAAKDKEPGVRNNATRALSCIARSQTPLAGLIPRAIFINMLNSGTWVDRNKGMGLLSALSQNDPHLKDRVRDKAFQSLCDMAVWDEPHAGWSRKMLSQISNANSENVDDGDVKNLIELASNKYRRAVLQNIFDADQSDWNHSMAYDCFQKLIAMRPLFSGTKDEGRYLYSLSFETFHLGQRQAMTEHNSRKALEYFKTSLQHAEEAVRFWQGLSESSMARGDSQWANYVRATIAYMENDLVGLKSLTTECGSDNRIVVGLLSGLAKFKNADYFRDYTAESNSDPLFNTLDQISAKLEHLPNAGGVAADCYNKLLEDQPKYKDSPLKQMYYHWLSEAAFQSGLSELKLGSNAAAIAYFEKSLVAADQEYNIQLSHNNNYGSTRTTQTKDFIRANIAYAEGNVNQLQTLVGRCGARNEIVDMLADGLMTFAKPDYQRDVTSTAL